MGLCGPLLTPDNFWHTATWPAFHPSLPPGLQSVEATNHMAERAHRFDVLWRKRRQGTWSDKGNRWVERVLSVRHTCRIQGRPPFPLMVEAGSCLFNGEVPDRRWSTRHAPLPTPSPP
jgi:hypothetical protein